LLERTVWDRIRSLETVKGENHTQKHTVSRFRRRIYWWCRPRTETCESKAVGKDGKPLAGAKTSLVKKCMADTCATKAMSQDGKPLSGAAKTSFMNKCEKGA
jgi:hypothetical protein